MKRNLLFLICLQFIIARFLLAEESDFLETKEESFRASSLEPLEVFIDVDAGEVSVVKSQSEREGKVLFRYNEEQFKADCRFFEEKNRLRVSLDKPDWMKWLSKKKHENHEIESKVEVFLPYGVDIFLDTRLKAGKTVMELGGLKLKELNFDNWAGEAIIRFQEPNPVVMEFLDVHSKVGEMDLFGLGNARFERADIDGGIGQLKVHFDGALLDESKAKVDLDIGEALVYLPSDMGIRMFVGGELGFLSHKQIDASFYRRGRYYITENYKAQKKKFSLRITPGLGELKVEREQSF
jgi:hypothetical protein